MDALLFSLTSRSARNQRLGMVSFQDCRHQFPFYSTDSLHDFWGIRGSRLWMSDDAEKLHFQGMGAQSTGGQTDIRSSKQHSFLPSHAKFRHIYMQLKGNIHKTTLWNSFSTPKVNLEHSFSLSNPSLLPVQTA
jgi:hypothetical protein